MRTLLVIIGVLVAGSTFANPDTRVHRKHATVIVVKKNKTVKRKVWVPGHWVKTRNGRVWVAGHWRRV